MRLIKKKEYIFKIMAISAAFILLFSQIRPQEALASRNKSGGGDDMGEFSWGNFAMSAGMSVGSTIIGGAISSGLKGIGSGSSATGAIQAADSLATLEQHGYILPQFGPLATSATVVQIGDPLFNLPQINPLGTIASASGSIASAGSAMATTASTSSGFFSSMGNYFSSLSSLKNVASIAVSGYTTFTTVSQAGRAVAMAGAYYEWKPSTTFLLSNVVSGAVGGFLNPGIAMGDTIPKIPAGDVIAQTAFETSGYNMAKGAFIGGLKNFAEAGVIAAIDGKSINQGKQPGALAQIGGLWAGVAAGNFSRGLVNPETWHYASKGIFKAEPNDYKLASEAASNLGDSYLANEFEQKAKQPDIFSTLKIANPRSGKTQWRELSINEVTQLEKWAKDDNFDFRGSRELFEVVQKNAHIGTSQIGSRLLEAIFIKTADMWPQLASRSLSISASNALRENHNGLSSFMSSAVEGITTPLFSGLADTFALRPGLYAGENQLVNSFEYINSMSQLTYIHKMDKIGTEFYAAYAQNQDNPDALKSALQKIANKHNLGIKISAVNTIGELKQQMEKTLLEAVDISDKQKEKLLTDALERPFNPASATLGVANSQARVKIEADIKKLETLDEVFKSVGTDRFALAFKSATSGLKFGLIEGAMHGGVSYLTSKFSEKNDLLVAAATAYGASMLTGAIRGVIWEGTWEPSIQKKEMVWRDRKSEYMPESYKGEDWFQAKISQYTYPHALESFHKPQELTGLPIELRAKRELEGTTWANKPAEGYVLSAFDEKPSLKQAMLYSLAKSNDTFLRRAFAFGIPQQLPPQNINTLVMSDYFRQLNSYAMAGAGPEWLTSGINSGSINASSFAISNNILTSMAAIKPVADTFNMRRQRITLTNAPLQPLMGQGLDYRSWAAGAETRWYLDEISAQSRTGKSFLREGK